MSEMAAETRLVGGGLGSLPRVNLMPPEIAQQAQVRKVQGGLVGAVALAVAAMGFLYVGASDAVSTAEDSLATATAEQSTLQKQKADLASVTAVYAQAAAAQTLLTQAMGQEVRYSRLLNDMSLSLPDGVWLTSAEYTQGGAGTPAAAAAAAPVAAAPAATGSALAATGSSVGTLKVSGFSYEHDDVANWLDATAKVAGLQSPLLESSARDVIGSRTVVKWSATVDLSTKALSGRYTTTPAGS